MEILRTTGVATKTAFVEKSIGSLVLYTDVKLDSLDLEKINIIVDRNGLTNNINITPSAVSLKKFAMACSYGDDAATCFPTGVDESWETVVVMELAEGGAIPLAGNDKIKIELSGLDVTKTYILDGIEEPTTVDFPFTFEEKTILASTTSISLNTVNYDVAILEDSNSVVAVDYRYVGGRVCTYSRRELRALSQNIDPVAYVRKDGKVSPCYAGLIQLPLLLVEEISIRKTNAAEVNFLFRVDMTPDSKIG